MKKIIFLTLLGFLFAFRAEAAVLKIVSNNNAPEINQPIQVDLVLDTKGDTMNAIQGEIVFPQSLFTLQSISDGASPVSFWIEAPHAIDSGTVSFSGIIPNGFVGTASSVISLELQPIASGEAQISIINPLILKNDGNATPISMTTSSAMIDVASTVASSTPSTTISFVTPEPFTPIIATSSNIFNGDYFLAFSTTDKGSGVDHYEVREVSSGSPTSTADWIVATSPYLLEDQSLSSDIYLKAVDHAGNFIIVKLSAEHPELAPVNRAKKFTMFALIGLGLLLLVFSLLFFRRCR